MLSKFIYLNLFSIILVSSHLLSFAISLETKVELVQLLFRHGDRTPVNSYPTDPYNETTWTRYGGFGQLTQNGMNRHYSFGKALRERYGLLSKIYDRSRVNARSTDYDRTLMSAYSVLSGLFEPVDYQKWNQDINWQPIAVHTTDAKADMLFYSGSCPRYDELRNEVEKSDEYIKLNTKYSDLFELIKKDAGLDKMDLIDLWEVGDTLVIERANGLKLPDWAEKNFDDISNSLKWGFYFDYRLPEQAKIRSGTILNQMRKNVISKTTNSSFKLELGLFSGHDTYVAALVKLLNLTQDINQPPFASAVILELRSSLSNPKDFYIQVIYKNNTPSDPIDLTRAMSISGCDILCPLDEFLKLTESMVVEDPVIECKSKMIGMYTNLILALAIGFVSLFGLCVSTLALLSFFKSRSISKGYRRVNL